DLQHQPLSQPLGCVFPSALAAEQGLDLLLDPVGLEAGAALVEVPLQFLAGTGVALGVEKQVYVRDDRRAVESIEVGFAHCGAPVPLSVCSDVPVAASTAFSRVDPRSRSTSASWPRGWLRPRCSLDITVPIGVPMISAISLQGNPSTAA